MPFLRHETSNSNPIDWDAALNVLVDSWVDEVDAEYVIIRRRDIASEKLELVAYAAAQSARAISSEFCVPTWKESCSDTKYSVDSWGAWSYPTNLWDALSPGEQSAYAAGETAFIKSLKQKCAFPLRIDESENITGIVVSQSAEPTFNTSTVIPWWLFAQLSVSSYLTSALHAGFVASVETLSGHDDLLELGCTRLTPSYLNQISTVLASSLGLGWNRVWFLRQDEINNQFVCDACVGELTRDQWLHAVKTRERQAQSLFDELATCAAFDTVSRDSLQKVVTGKPLRFEYPGFDGQLNKRLRTVYDQAQCPGSVHTVEPLPSTVTEQFLEQIYANIGSEGDFLADDDVFYYPIVLRGERYVVVLNNAYEGSADNDTQRVLTTLFLEALRIHLSDTGQSNQESLWSRIKSWSMLMNLSIDEKPQFAEMVSELRHISLCLKRDLAEPPDETLVKSVDDVCIEDLLPKE